MDADQKYLIKYQKRYKSTMEGAKHIRNAYQILKVKHGLISQEDYDRKQFKLKNREFVK